MRYSNTAITELSKKYRTILKKCAILNAVALLALSTPAMAEVFEPISITDKTIQTLNPNDGIVEINTDSTDGIFVKFHDSGITINADTVSISTTNDGNVSAIWAQSNGDATKPADNAAYVNITANEINLSGKEKAVTAMSNGVINLSGNTTITADSAILARGYSVVNINTEDTSKTLKMNGNIDFNYNHKTSQTAIDADINVSLNGTDSYWTGNTVKSWDDVKPEDPNKLIVSNATVSLNEGATWNATKITATDTMEQTALNNLIVKKGTSGAVLGCTNYKSDGTGCDRIMSRDYYLRWLTTGYEEDTSVDKPSFAKVVEPIIPEVKPVKNTPVKEERKKPQVHTVEYQEKFIEKDGFLVVVDNEGQIITDMKLLSHLRGLRMQLAQKEQKAPYMIIKNKGLVSLATYRPTTKEEFINLNGLGETTYNNYGILFVNEIKEFYNN